MDITTTEEEEGRWYRYSHVMVTSVRVSRRIQTNRTVDTFLHILLCNAYYTRRIIAQYKQKLCFKFPRSNATRIIFILGQDPRERNDCSKIKSRDEFLRLLVEVSCWNEFCFFTFGNCPRITFVILYRQ